MSTGIPWSWTADNGSAVLFVVLALLARLLPAIWVTPFFGGALVPRSLRMGFALALAAVLAPVLAPIVPEIATASTPLLMAVLLKEIAIGVALAFVAGLVFYAAQSAGWLVDTVRGANMSEVLVPQSRARSTAMGSLLFQLVIVIFFALGGHRIFVLTIARSYEVLPLMGFVEHATIGNFALFCGKLTGSLIMLALSWAAPVVGAVVVMDLALGWLNRFAPQINSFFLAMPLKAGLGVAVMALSVGIFVLLLPEALQQAADQLERALTLLAG